MSRCSSLAAVVTRVPLALVLALVLALAVACGGAGDAGHVAPAPSSGSFGRLQASVVAPGCALSGCHVGRTPAGGLSLEAGVAYENLVRALPSEEHASREGLRRVYPFRPDSSLLYRKVVLAGGSDAYHYGSPMPMGGEPLSVGQVEFIRRWIAQGAPRTGDVADAALLADRTRQQVAVWTPLAPPPAGQGVQLRVDSFSVAANFERELFVYRRLDNPEPLYVTRIQTKMRAGSHHFLLETIEPRSNWPCYPAPDAVRDIRNADGSLNILAMLPMACHVFLGGSMVPENDYVFPEGVALELPANTGVDLNVHYANHAGATVAGEAVANLYTVPRALVRQVAHTLNFGNTSFSLPPRQRTTVAKTFTVAKQTTIVALTSHMHALGESFVIQLVGGPRDGEVVYENRDWEHPALRTFATPIVLASGQGLRSVITWNNTTDRTVSFGLQSTDEMGIIFGYYY